MYDQIKADFEKRLLESMQPRVVKKKAIITEGLESDIIRTGKAIDQAFVEFGHATGRFVNAVVKEFAPSMKIVSKKNVEMLDGEELYYVTFELQWHSENADKLEIAVFSDGDVVVRELGTSKRQVLKKPSVQDVVNTIEDH